MKHKLIIVIVLTLLLSACSSAALETSDSDQTKASQSDVVEASTVIKEGPTVDLTQRLAEDKLLPLGSIVQLYDGEVKVIIVGRVQKHVGNGNLYDYSSCIYPQGYMGSDQLYMFNHENIETLYFIGFEDAQEGEYQKLLMEHGY